MDKSWLGRLKTEKSLFSAIDQPLTNLFTWVPPHFPLATNLFGTVHLLPAHAQHSVLLLLLLICSHKLRWEKEKLAWFRDFTKEVEEKEIEETSLVQDSSLIQNRIWISVWCKWYFHYLIIPSFYVFLSYNLIPL